MPVPDFTIKNRDSLLETIANELADNNAGAISAYDVRHNMLDIVGSINQIVASGDFNVTNPFTGNVKAKIVSNTGGLFIAESGVNFPNGGGTQYVAYPGPEGLQHNTLSGLGVGDPHVQYLNLNGGRVMTNNLGTGSNWINSSGNSQVSSSNNRGLKFQYVSSTVENIIVGSGSKFTFNKDGSMFDTGNGVAKAWINFDSSVSPPVVKSSYNIHTLEKVATGKFKIYFTSGTLLNNNYVAHGSSNARSSADNGDDFDNNDVGTFYRTGDDASTLRAVSFHVKDKAGVFFDAEVNNLVVFGFNVGNSSGVPPIVIG
jgi:hypothetical protein